jgi:hypothetical protein
MNNEIQNCVQIDTKKIPEIIKIFRNKNQIPFFIGGPGTGKTESTISAGAEIAKSLGKNLVINPKFEDWYNTDNFCVNTILASQMDELDTKGLPSKDKKLGREITNFTPTELFPTVGSGIIFLDEFPNGNTRVQTAFQDILLEHRSGSYKISKDIMFVLAGNRPGDNCGTFFIPSALRNRVAWFEVNPLKLEKWFDLMDKIGRPIISTIKAFLLSVGSKHINNFDANKDHYAYGTYRSWEKASQIMEGLKDTSLIRTLVGGWVGLSAGADLVSFIELTNKVNINDILNNPTSINDYLNDIGTLYSICVNLIDLSEDTNKCEKIFNIMLQLKADEYGLFIVKGMINKFNIDGITKRIRKSKVGAQLMNKYVHLLKEK